MKYRNYKKKPPFFAGKGFYIVLAVCVLAVGVAAWSALDVMTSTDKDITSSLESEPSWEPPTESAADVGHTVSDVEKEPPVESAPEKEVSSNVERAPELTDSDLTGIDLSSDIAGLPDKFAIPLMGNIGKSFSDKELQPSATYGDMRLHLGVDIQGEKGSPVVSAAAGEVMKVANDALWGKMVVIDHGGGIICYYCGLDNTTVSQGEAISAGTKIGEVGEVPCESADKSHIHIAITREGKYISPLELMKQ